MLGAVAVELDSAAVTALVAHRGLGCGAAPGRDPLRGRTRPRPGRCGGSAPATVSSSTTSSRRSSAACLPRPRTSCCGPRFSTACADRSAMRSPAARRPGRLEELERANLLIIPLDDSGGGTATTRCSRRSSAPGCGSSAPASPGSPCAGGGLACRTGRRRRGDRPRPQGGRPRADVPHGGGGLASLAQRRGAQNRPPVARCSPGEAVRGDPQLSTSYAWCLVLPGETDGVAERLADVERALAVDHDRDAITDAAVRTQLALIRSRLADLEGDAPTAIAQARLARELLPAGLPPEGETTLRGDATILLARGWPPRATWTAPPQPTRRPYPTCGQGATSSRPIERSPTWPSSRSRAGTLGAARLCEAEIALALGRPVARPAAPCGPWHGRGWSLARPTRPGRGSPRPRARNAGRRRAGCPVRPLCPRARRGDAGAR